MTDNEFKKYLNLCIKEWLILGDGDNTKQDIINFAEFLRNDTETRLEELEEKKDLLFNKL